MALEILSHRSPRVRAYSRQGREALTLLGQLIRIYRIEKKMGVFDLASRLGISRDMMQRIEKGDPRCGIGAVFEAATIVGVPLFAEDPGRLSDLQARYAEKISLLPKSIKKKSDTVIKDDF